MLGSIGQCISLVACLFNQPCDRFQHCIQCRSYFCDLITPSNLGTCIQLSCLNAAGHLLEVVEPLYKRTGDEPADESYCQRGENGPDDRADVLVLLLQTC